MPGAKSVKKTLYMEIIRETKHSSSNDLVSPPPQRTTTQISLKNPLAAFREFLLSRSRSLIAY